MRAWLSLIYEYLVFIDALVIIIGRRVLNFEHAEVQGAEMMLSVACSMLSTPAIVNTGR